MFGPINSRLLAYVILAGVISILWSLDSCLPGPHPPPPPLSAQLEGSWFGTVVNDQGRVSTMTVIFDEGGNITSISTAPGLTGTTSSSPLASSSQLPGWQFDITLSDATDGGFYVDPGFAHAVIVDESFVFGVLQKEATVLPTFSAEDLVGKYDGQTVQVNPSFDLAVLLPSAAKVLADLSFSTTRPGNSASGDVVVHDLNFGLFDLIFDDPSVTGRVILSPDKSFAGAYDCASDATFPQDCGISAWTQN